MPPPPPEPQSQNEKAQEGNGASTVLTEFLDKKMLTMASTVVTYPVIVSTVRNPPVVTPFPLKINVPPPLPPPLLTEPLPLIMHPPSPSAISLRFGCR